MMEMKEISKSYGKKQVVQDIDLHIATEKLTAFIGPNGAGKSTLLSIASRLIEKDRGEIYLDGSEVKTWKSNELAQKLSILKQSNGVSLNITVEELVNFGRFPYSKGRLTKKDRLKVKESLLALGLMDLADQPINTLSGGQLQRAHIAMILAQDTDYIL